MTKQDKELQQRAINFWQQSADHDRKTAKSLFKLQHYDWSLFIYHLSIEKILKALIIQSEKTPPPVHKLVRLAELADLEVTDEQRSWLTEVTDFNMEARYPEEKFSFYHKATSSYTKKWHQRCDEIYVWLKAKLQN